MRTKYLFIDRDGTLIKEPPDEQIDTLEKLELLPGVIRNLHKIQNQLDYRIVMVTNQDGLGTNTYPEEAFNKVQSKLMTLLGNEGIQFDSIKIDRSVKENPSINRKPSIEMIKEYLNDNLNREQSFAIGDRETDIEMAERAGLKGIQISKTLSGYSENKVLVAKSWDEIYEFLSAMNSTVSIYRQTKETDIRGKINLYGQGKSEIQTGIGFFDHMLNQLPSHSNIDLFLKTTGDLEVDEHHTIEDTGLALGEAIIAALGNKKGMQRYGFSLPMDESSASCLMDLGGRPNLVWNVEFRREYIGQMPTEMFEHFFKSFADASKSTIHIDAQGKNEHHKIEAVFKAFSRALKMAIRKVEQEEQLPTSKGRI
jgi:imidazoleglycerol-phosphate dehydratase/histidinol-phosphatase